METDLYYHVTPSGLGGVIAWEGSRSSVQCSKLRRAYFVREELIASQSYFRDPNT